MSRKHIALAAVLTLVLGISTPLAATTRDGGGGRGLDPIQRIVKLIRQLLHPITTDLADPLPPHP